MARKKFTQNDPDNVVNNIMQLRDEFIRFSGGDKFDHKKVYHKNGWYIYKVRDSYYEVFKEKIRKMTTYVDGKVQHTGMNKVAYPNDEDFGKCAWCVMTYEHALKIIEKKTK